MFRKRRWYNSWPFKNYESDASIKTNELNVNWFTVFLPKQNILLKHDIKFLNSLQHISEISERADDLMFDILSFTKCNLQTNPTVV